LARLPTFAAGMRGRQHRHQTCTYMYTYSEISSNFVQQFLIWFYFATW
jgi:hypothetical protein